MGLLHIDVEHSAVHMVAELTLILVLFTDSARIDLVRLRLVSFCMALRLVRLREPTAASPNAWAIVRNPKPYPTCRYDTVRWTINIWSDK